MNSSSLQCPHSHNEYKQLYDLVEQSGSVTVNAQNARVESEGSLTITATNIQMLTPLSLSQRIALLQQVGNLGCSKCAVDMTQKAADWLNNPESNLTERAILYLATAYKIQKKCNSDLTEIEKRLSEAFDCCLLLPGNNLLHHFIECEYFPVIDYLLKCKFQEEKVKSWLEQKNGKGCLPIHVAIMAGNIHIVNLLLQFCPSVILNTQDEDGNTPLHLAVQRAIKSKEDRQKFQPVIKNLLDLNADPRVKNFNRERPLDLASDEVKNIFFSSNQFCLYHVRNQITCFYTSNDREIKRSFWVDALPLKIEECFINLSIVKEEAQKNKEKEALGKNRNREQIFGGYEDVFKAENKKPIDPKDLFEPRYGKNPKRLLILGRAGIGKSTLCQYLTHQWWGNDGVWKNRFDLVVRINLRNLTKDNYPSKKVSLEEMIVSECFQITSEEKEEIKHVKKVLNFIPDEKKLFLLDGYDEFPADSPCKTAINTLLSSQNGSYLIVTSRPYASIRSTDFDCCLECIGFTSEDIPNYLNLPGICENVDAAEKILAFLKKNPAIHNLAHIPILLDLFTRSSKTILASKSITMTMLYGDIVNKIWERYHKRLLELNPNQKEKNADAVKKAKQFLKTLAFHSFLKHGIVFSYDSVENVAMDACKWEKDEIAGQVESLMTPGFLNCYRGKTLAESQYSFPHLTIQEYLAALYITDWLSTDQEMQVYNESKNKTEKITAKQFIVKNRYNPRFQIIWNFVSGILADSKPEYVQDFFNCLLQEPKDIIGAYHTSLLISCLEEAEISELENADLLIQLKKDCQVLIGKGSLVLLDTLKLSHQMVTKLEIIEWITSVLEKKKLAESDENLVYRCLFFFRELAKQGYCFPETSIQHLKNHLLFFGDQVTNVFVAIAQGHPNLSEKMFGNLLQLSAINDEEGGSNAIAAIGRIVKSGLVSKEKISEIISFLTSKLFSEENDNFDLSYTFGELLSSGFVVSEEVVLQLKTAMEDYASESRASEDCASKEDLRREAVDWLGLIVINNSDYCNQILEILDKAFWEDPSFLVRQQVVRALSQIAQKQELAAENAIGILLTIMERNRNQGRDTYNRDLTSIQSEDSLDIYGELLDLRRIICDEVSEIILKSKYSTEELIKNWVDFLSHSEFDPLALDLLYPKIYKLRKKILPVLQPASDLITPQSLLQDLKSETINCVDWLIKLAILEEMISSERELTGSIVDELIGIWIAKKVSKLQENRVMYHQVADVLVRAVRSQKNVSLETIKKLTCENDEEAASILIRIVKMGCLSLESLVCPIENDLLEGKGEKLNVYSMNILSHAAESGFEFYPKTISFFIKSYLKQKRNSWPLNILSWLDLAPYASHIEINDKWQFDDLNQLFEGTSIEHVLAHFLAVPGINEVIAFRFVAKEMPVYLTNNDLCFWENNKFCCVAVSEQFIDKLKEEMLISTIPCFEDSAELSNGSDSSFSDEFS
ncbi:MAG: NACHT domain-containing protein [Parachlamydiaceae bacterium]